MAERAFFHRRLTTPSSVNEIPFVRIRSGRARPSVATIRELWIYRDVLRAMTARLLKVRYKQALLGIAWVMLQPLLAALLFAVFLGVVAHIPGEGAPYVLFVLTGMVIWQGFSTCVSYATESLVAEAGLLRKVYFPREVVPLARILAGMVDLGAGLIVLAIVAIAFGRFPNVAWLALPIPVLTFGFAAAGIGMALAAINVRFRDVKIMTSFILQLGLFATPVVYSLHAMPEPWRSIWGIVNPLAGAIDAVRTAVLHATWPSWPITLGSLVGSAVLAVAGYAVIKASERQFADIV